jgi:Fic family protein
MNVTSVGLDPRSFEQRLYELTEKLPYWTDRSLLDQAVMLHHKAVPIHPFENGNGRWSRMLASIWLHLHGSAITQWPGTWSRCSVARR